MVRRGRSCTNSDIRDLTLPQVSSGIPVPTVFYSSPLTRASRTLEITWTDITLPGESHHGQLCPSHEVVVFEVRPHLQVLSPFKFIVCLCRIVVKPLECISVISVIPNPGSRRTPVVYLRRRIHRRGRLPSHCKRNNMSDASAG